MGCEGARGVAGAECEDDTGGEGRAGESSSLSAQAGEEVSPESTSDCAPSSSFSVVSSAECWEASKSSFCTGFSAAFVVSCRASYKGTVTGTIGAKWSSIFCALSLGVVVGRRRISRLRRAPALGCKVAKGNTCSSKTTSREI
jgi:hypothetical protein